MKANTQLVTELFQNRLVQETNMLISNTQFNDSSFNINLPTMIVMSEVNIFCSM